MTQKTDFFLQVYLTQKVCEVCRLFNSSSNFDQGLDYWLTDKSSFIKKLSLEAFIVRHSKFKVSVAE